MYLIKCKLSLLSKIINKISNNHLFLSTKIPVLDYHSNMLFLLVKLNVLYCTYYECIYYCILIFNIKVIIFNIEPYFLLFSMFQKFLI